MINGAEMPRTPEELVQWEQIDLPERLLLADAQTSGGLLLCVAPENLGDVLRVLRSHSTMAGAVVGKIIASGKPGILVRP